MEPCPQANNSGAHTFSIDCELDREAACLKTGCFLLVVDKDFSIFAQKKFMLITL